MKHINLSKEFCIFAGLGALTTSAGAAIVFNASNFTGVLVGSAIATASLCTLGYLGWRTGVIRRGSNGPQ